MKLDGKLVSNELIKDLKGKFSGVDTGLCIIQVGDDFASNRYIKQKEKLAEQLGVNFKLLKFDNITTEDLCLEIDKLNDDEAIDGIIVQLPLPDELDYDTIRNRISSIKDIDGITDINIGKLASGKAYLISCTALGVLELLDYYKIDLEGKNVCIVGRSIHIGKALANLLTERNATVTLCHSKTSNLEFYTKNSDIVISCVGKPKFIKQDMVKDDVILVDVGFNYLDGKTCGDVDSELEKYKYLSPVPGGVGPMTVCAVYKNLYNSYLENHKEESNKKKEDDSFLELFLNVTDNLGIKDYNLITVLGEMTFKEISKIRESLFLKIRNERSLLLSRQNSEKYRKDLEKNNVLLELKKDITYLFNLVLKSLDNAFNNNDIASVRVYLEQVDLFVKYSKVFNEYFDSLYITERTKEEIDDLRKIKNEIKYSIIDNNRQYVKK